MAHKHSVEQSRKSQGEKKTAFVVFFSVAAMILEIIFGLLSKSMALLADGIHMGSHVLAIGLSWGAYVLVRRFETRHKDDVDSKRVLSLSAYTSGVLLLMFAVVIIVEAVERFFAPVVAIRYVEAMIVATLGMVINMICAFVLHAKHGDEQEDYNRHSAYLHVLADALTSLGAIFGLICAMIWDIVWMDTIIALVCSIVIIRWALNLLYDTGKSLTYRVDNFCK